MDAARAGGAKVLVAEDHASSAELLHRLLSVAGFHPATVRSPGVAAQAVLDEDVSVVLVSYRVEGIAATTRLVGELRSRPEPALRDVGIVALVDDAADARFGLDVDADAVIVRPVDAEVLIDVVTDVAATDPAARPARRGLRPV